MSLQAQRYNSTLDLSGKTAVITGATQGIGEGIALRCAQLGASRIFIVGRNAERGHAVLERLRAAATERSGPDNKQQFEFLKADLSTIKTVQTTAAYLQQKAGTHGIDYLLMTQGGPPNGKYEETSEGHEGYLALHCLSRFGMTYLLAKGKALRSDASVVTVHFPGWDYSEVDLEDLSLKKLHATQPWRVTMLLTQARRDSALNDAFTLEFNRRYPSMRFYHLYPGYVQTSASANQGVPFPVPQLSSFLGPFLAKTLGNTPLGYSDIPVFFAANPEARKLVGFMFSERLKRIQPGKWAQDQTNCERLFEKLSGLFP